MSNDRTTTAAVIDPLRTPKELCRQGGFSAKTLRRLELAGEAPPCIVITERCVRYKQSAIDTWLAARTRTYEYILVCDAAYSN